MTERVCETCGGPLPPPKIPAPPRRYCSESCRKTQYMGECIDCGAPTNGSDGRGRNAPLRCCTCNSNAFGAIGAATMRERYGWRRERIAELWAQGLTLREIAADLDTTAAAIGVTVHRMRAEGWDVPYRYAGYGRRSAVA